MQLSEELAQRGFIQQHTAGSLAELFDGPKRTVYHGIDPSADSAHAGNFVNWMFLRHLAQAGHHVIFLVGGGTGMIGDPKPDAERVLKPKEEVDANVAKLKAQAEQVVGAGTTVTFVNNQDWLLALGLISFLRDIGKHFTVNELIKKDAIATRLTSENGISYTEFAYPLLQAYDYFELHQRYGCDLQIGGSDQWGNIVAGVDLVRRKTGATVHAATVPLIIDKATGKKFGKSEGNAVWLDAAKTTPFAFYQFWFNTADDSVIDFLKLFTLIPLSEIATIEKTFAENPGARSAQKQLAAAVTALVHGVETAAAVAHAAAALFGQVPLTELSADEKTIVMENAPVTTVAEGSSIVTVLTAAGLARSNREARTFIESGAIAINDVKIEVVDTTLTTAAFGDLLLLKRGKKQLSVVVLTS